MVQALLLSAVLELGNAEVQALVQGVEWAEAPENRRYNICYVMGRWYSVFV